MACDLCGKSKSELIKIRQDLTMANFKYICISCKNDSDKIMKHYMFNISKRLFKRWVRKKQKRCKKY